MALIPLKNTVTITPASTYDDWGEPVSAEPYTLKCRIQEGTKVVRGMTNNGGVHGVSANEVVSTAQFYFDKIAPITLTDTLTYTDEAGRTRTYTPISIEIKRGLNGKPILTVVNV